PVQRSDTSDEHLEHVYPCRSALGGAAAGDPAVSAPARSIRSHGRRAAWISAAVVLLIASAAASQSVDDFDAWMRTIDEKNQSVQQSIARKDGSATAADAAVLQTTFKSVEDFWVRRGDGPDAVDLAKEARERASDVAQASAAQDFDGAAAQAIKVAET